MKALTRTVRDNYGVLLMMQAIVDHGGVVVAVVADGRPPLHSGFPGTPNAPHGGHREVYAVVPDDAAIDAIDAAYDKAVGP